MRLDDGREIDCLLPASISTRQRNALCVGDRVQVCEGPGGAHVEGVEPRRSALSRPSPARSGGHREHVLAANVDRVVVVVAARQPPPRPGLVDRMLIAVECGGAEAILCMNKWDLAGDDFARLEALLAPYEELGVPVVRTAVPEDGAEPELDRLPQLLAGHGSVMVGPSGVGKSTLLNALAPEAQAPVGEVGSATQKGRHTTTRARLYELPGGGRLIDTPGVREFGLWEVRDRDVLRHFRDVEAVAAACRFRSCRHDREPGCAVREAVAAGILSPARVESRARLLQEAQARPARRRRRDA